MHVVEFPSPLGVISSLTKHRRRKQRRQEFPSPLGVISSLTDMSRISVVGKSVRFPSPLGVISSLTNPAINNVLSLTVSVPSRGYLFLNKPCY